MTGFPRRLIPALFAFCCVVSAAGAAGPTPADFAGLWKFDPDRTRDVFGYASVRPDAVGTGLMEINLAGRYVALSLSDGGYNKKTIFAAEVARDLLLLHADDGSTVQLRILDLDALALREGGTRAVFVRLPTPVRH